MGKAQHPSLTAAQRAALAPLTDFTAPHLGEMIGVLVALARSARKDALKERAASRVIELHLMALGQADLAMRGGEARIVVIQPEQLDRVEAAHRQTLVAEVSR